MTKTPTVAQARKAVQDASASATRKQGAATHLGTAWDKPVPLGSRHVLPPFPVDALPKWVADMVKGVAEETQTPPDLPGTIALASLSAAAGGLAIVRVRPGWDEPVNIYSAAVAEPGTRKSAVYRALTAPLYVAERSLNEKLAAERYEQEVERDRLAEVDKKAREAAIRAKEGAEAGKAVQAAAAAARALDEVRIPAIFQLIASDVSPEECISILDAQGGRLAIMSAEGRVFDIITGRYANGEPCLTPFLEGHAGDSLRVNRRGRYEYVERPALTIGVCIQPAVLRWIADKPRLRGQGLLARFLYSVPAGMVGYRQAESAAVSDEVRAAYDLKLKAMVLSLADWSDDPMILTPDDRARKLVIDYLAAIEPRLRPDGDLYGLRDWAAKLAGATVRIAGLLHVSEHLKDGYAKPIDELVMRRALQLGDYFTAHALAAFGVMAASPHLGLAGDILGWLYPDGAPTYRPEFSRRDAHRRFQERDGRTTTAEEIASSLRLLETHGYIRALPAPPRSERGGRPPAPKYEVCPTDPDGTDRNPEAGSEQR